MIIINKGHISHYKRKSFLKEVSDMKMLFKERKGNLEGKTNEYLE